MGCKDINNVPRENLILIRKSKFLKRRPGARVKEPAAITPEVRKEQVKPDAVETTEATPLKEKSKKLNFKKKNPCIEPILQDEKVSDIPLNEPKLQQPPILTKKPSKMYEYGSDYNGYTFIAFKESEIPIQKETEEPISEEEGIVPANDLDSDSEISYQKYISVWKEIEAGVYYDMFPLPVKTDLIPDVNQSNIMEFLGTKEAVKKERLRWHPDKMKIVLSNTDMWNPQTEKVVTSIFQTINDLYQNI